MLPFGGSLRRLAGGKYLYLSTQQSACLRFQTGLVTLNTFVIPSTYDTPPDRRCHAAVFVRTVESLLKLPPLL